MEPTPDSKLVIPKDWIRAIRIPEGYPLAGALVEPCFCGYHTELEANYPVVLMQYGERLILCHKECVHTEEDDADI